MILDSVIFDLDGTLVDSAVGILSSFAAAFESSGIAPRNALNSKIIGPPLRHTMCQLAGTDDRQLVDFLIGKFKSHYDSIGYLATIEYPGSGQLLSNSSKLEIPIFIATNKRIVPTERIIDMLGWRDYFKKIYSLDSFLPAVNSKGQLILEILKQNKLNPKGTLYVGDRIEDSEAAIMAGVNFYHAKWGYEQEAAVKNYIGGSMEKLVNVMLNPKTVIFNE